MMDVIEFFTLMTGLIPTKDQIDVLRNFVDLGIKKMLISAGRQSGKTLTTAVGVLWFIFEYPIPIKILLISAQDNVLYFHIREIFKRNPQLESEIVAQGTYSIVPLKGFETKRGAIVYVRGSTDRQVRGLPADIVVVDEAAEIKDDIITTALGNLSGNISKFILLSTPHKSSLFVQLASDPKKHGFKLFTWSAVGLSWHSKELLASKKSMMSSQKYKVEVLGLPLTRAERAFLPSKHIDKCIHESVIKEGTPNSRIEIGIDWGSGRSPIEAIVTEKLYSRRKVLDIKSWSTKNMSNCFKELGDFIIKWNPDVVKADSMPPEFKGKVEPYSKPFKINYVIAQFCKNEMLGQLKHKVQLHQLEIDERFVDLIIQLRKYKRGMQYKDDKVDALCLSIYEPSIPFTSKPQGKVIFPE